MFGRRMWRIVVPGRLAMAVLVWETVFGHDQRVAPVQSARYTESSGDASEESNAENSRGNRSVFSEWLAKQQYIQTYGGPQDVPAAQDWRIGSAFLDWLAKEQGWGVDPQNGTTTKKTEEGHCLYPGMMFALAQDRIEKSKLYKIIRKLPKGSLLHCHVEAMVDYRWLFKHVLTVPGMHVSSSCPILSLPQDGENAVLNFTHLNKEQNAGGSLCVDSYVPDSWIPVVEDGRYILGPQVAEFEHLENLPRSST